MDRRRTRGRCRPPCDRWTMRAMQPLAEATALVRGTGPMPQLRRAARRHRSAPSADSAPIPPNPTLRRARRRRVLASSLGWDGKLRDDVPSCCSRSRRADARVPRGTPRAVHLAAPALPDARAFSTSSLAAAAPNVERREGIDRRRIARRASAPAQRVPGDSVGVALGSASRISTAQQRDSALQQRSRAAPRSFGRSCAAAIGDPKGFSAASSRRMPRRAVRARADLRRRSRTVLPPTRRYPRAPVLRAARPRLRLRRAHADAALAKFTSQLDASRRSSRVRRRSGFSVYAVLAAATGVRRLDLAATLAKAAIGVDRALRDLPAMPVMLRRGLRWPRCR